MSPADSTQPENLQPRPDRHTSARKKRRVRQPGPVTVREPLVSLVPANTEIAAADPLTQGSFESNGEPSPVFDPNAATTFDRVRELRALLKELELALIAQMECEVRVCALQKSVRQWKWD